MIKFIGCPESNFRRGRPFGLRPEAIVIHIMDGSFTAGESVFRDPTTHKSAHYGISRSGEIHQYLDENDTGFHAGIVVNPTWELLRSGVNPNFYTIGIEHEGRPDDVWPETQLQASATLIGQIAARWDIPLDDSHVIRHHQIRDSKTCPGNWLKIGELLKRVPARLEPSGAAMTAAATDSRSASEVKFPVVRTIRNVNLRQGKPSTAAQVVRVILQQTDVVVARFEVGESVGSNAFWYGDAQGNFFWAGATNVPDPTVAA
jgi:N-acetylmuramoyl-L-alanine amidase